MIRRISRIFLKTYPLRAPLLFSSRQLGYNRIPCYQFCLQKQLQQVSTDIFQRSLAEYELTIDAFEKEKLDSFSLNQILQCLIIISQYIELVDPLHRQFSTQINVGILAFLKELQKRTENLDNYFELIASNYFLVSHKLIHNLAEENWKKHGSQIDKLDINQAIKLLYLSKIVHLVEEEQSDGPYTDLELVYNIISRNANKYTEQLPKLEQSLAVYLCILLKYVKKHTNEHMVPVQQDFEKFVKLLTEKIIKDINQYSSQKIMDHVTFLSGMGEFKEVCQLFEQKLVEQDKNYVPPQVSETGVNLENKSPLSPNQWIELVSDAYNEGRQHMMLLEYVKAKMISYGEKELTRLDTQELPDLFFILSKANLIDEGIASKFSQLLISNMPSYNAEQLAKIFFSFSHSRQMDGSVFENLIFFLEQQPLDLNSVGILFFTLGTQQEHDEYSERMTQYLSEEKLIYMLEAEDEFCDQQFVLSFLSFCVNQDQLSSSLFQGYIFEEFKQTNEKEPLQIGSILVKVLQILGQKPEASKQHLSQEFKDYLASTYQQHKGDMQKDIISIIEGELIKLELPLK